MNRSVHFDEAHKTVLWVSLSHATRGILCGIGVYPDYLGWDIYTRPVTERARKKTLASELVTL